MRNSVEMKHSAGMNEKNPKLNISPQFSKMTETWATGDNSGWF